MARIIRADQLADAFEAHEPEPSDEGRASSLMALRFAVRRRAAADREVLDAVADARKEGISWAGIGAALGTSGEAARQRNGALIAG